MSSYKFKKNMSIGAMDATEDKTFLDKCFIDTGYFDEFININSSKAIAVGRTGSGKTALLEKIKNTQDNVIVLQPQELSLNYITNSNIINFLDTVGVKLDQFYILLWKHVLAVELIKKRYKINNEDTQSSFIEKITQIFNRDTSKKIAFEYLEEWGKNFWLETDVRIQELTTKLEENISNKIDLKSYGVPISSSGAKKLSSEKKEEVISRINNIVDANQIKKLSKVIELLSEDIFANKQQKYYIVIDRLDDEWVDNDIRYKLIRSLIETIKVFRRIEPVKIIIALRSDLLYRVFDRTRDGGFQEEKYEDFILHIKWSKEELKNLLDKRIELLIRENYTTKSVDFDKIFTGKPDRYKPIDFLLERTLLRPRDAISFVNECFNKASGKTNITSEILKDAEKIYSKRRFNALCDEWEDDYPLLEEYCDILPDNKNKFEMKDINKIDEFILSLSIKNTDKKDKILSLCREHTEKENITYNENIVLEVLKILYQVGILGIKRDSRSAVEWSHEDEASITINIIKDCQSFRIHKMVSRYLGR